ncbi:MAG: hypothetical protein LBM77_13735 [Spirochaetaceae bacterium]|nr:hypothetical protein [Spirochaetaceae bacterium]
MRLDPFLRKAVRLIKQGKASKAVDLLKYNHSLYHSSISYYYITAMACMYCQDFGEAHSYLREGSQLKQKEPHLQAALACLYLRHRDYKRAVELYLELSEMPDADKGLQNLATRALQIIRTKSGKDDEHEELNFWVISKKIRSLFPPLPFVGPSAKTVTLCTVVVLIAGTALAWPVVQPFIASLVPRPATRPEIAAAILTATDKKEPMEQGGEFRYLLSQKQVEDTYSEALNYFAKYKDEKARANLNKILLSNASTVIKNKARVLQDSLRTPGFDTLDAKDSFSFSEVVGDPALYAGCSVRWPGFPSNILTKDSETAFILLVGPDAPKVVEGTVPVRYSRALQILPERPLEVLGRVSGDTPSSLILEGTALLQSVAKP